ncbi:hypothetical protein BH11MYX4_BH11MYX4_41480 [soil metagenome]
MSGSVNGISGSGSRYFDDEELKALQRDPSIVWAKNDGPASYKAALDNVRARDARYEAAHVSYRM